MSDIEKNEQQPERKKLSLKEAMEQKLASKKQAMTTGQSKNSPVKDQTKKSQQTKKVNNQRKRTGV